LSRKQYAYASARILEEGLQDRVRIELRDYRDIDGCDTYDKIASVGMFEHVGLKNLPVYFATAHRLHRVRGDLLVVRWCDRPQQSVCQADLQAVRGHLRLVCETMRRA
jgi:cyclopropane fatty-acyl-phospholipid synthase-like methyltransferase